MTETAQSKKGHLRLRIAWGVWKSLRTTFVPLLCFVLGIAVGTLIGSVAERGPGATFERIAPAPLHALPRLLMWGLVFLLVSCLWRVPRRVLIGKHDLGAVPCFVAAAFTATSHYLGVVFLYKLQLMTVNWSQSTNQVFIVVVLFLASALVAVECEACISRWISKRSHRHP